MHEKFLYTKPDGTKVEVTVKSVNTKDTVVKGKAGSAEKDVTIPAGQSVVVTTDDGTEFTVVWAALTNAEEEAVLLAPAAPDNKIYDEADEAVAAPVAAPVPAPVAVAAPTSGNAASTASTELVASVVALFSMVTLTR